MSKKKIYPFCAYNKEFASFIKLGHLTYENSVKKILSVISINDDNSKRWVICKRLTDFYEG